MKPDNTDLSRRAFIGSVAAAGAAAVSACATAGGPRAQTAAAQPAGGLVTPKAPDGPVLKAGLVGCGGRGRGAAANFLDAGPNLQIVALADVFPDRVAEARQLLNGKRGQQIEEARCFTGFDACQKLLDSGVDVVLHATPPHFRPAHMAAVIAAGKHLFMEKPVAVDVPGAQAVMATAEKAASQGLSIMTGTQLRRDLPRMEVHRRVRGGEIGDIVAMRTLRNQGALWYRVPQPGWSDMEYQIRDWVNWTWLSGDIIVEQHIHHLDAILWVLDKTPVKATGMGAHVRRRTGDQYDFFSIDYEWDGGLHMHSTIRQLNGCANVREEVLVGTKGSANLDGIIYDLKGRQIWKYDGPENNSLVQEHVDWVTAIRSGKPVNTARDTAHSTLMAIMGRDSAYTGKAISWTDLLASTARLGPTEYALGPLPYKPEAPLAGVDHGPPLNATPTPPEAELESTLAS
ncbi:MAG TPA: Gfo/Idh/MocA family oxidoreductase [Vicinamibacterales bacterium]|nr:Gfo/Idh/MocA family oxidoreductase [Vicinamibacterales bacterium]